MILQTIMRSNSIVGVLIDTILPHFLKQNNGKKEIRCAGGVIDMSTCQSQNNYAESKCEFMDFDQLVNQHFVKFDF